LTITSDGEQRRDFTHVEDIVDGLVKCGFGLLEGKIKGEEFELGSGVNYSINELADMFGKDYPKEYIPKRKGEYDKTLCTDTNAHELLGWKPIKKLDEYVNDFVNNQK
jgi:UDP-glucose 4-epimerase